MRKRISIGLSVLALTLGVLTIGHASSSRDMPNFNGKYPSSTLVGNCSVCHTSPPSLNSYGSAYRSNGRNTAALTNIQDQDTDGDGATNLVEINAGTLPGNPGSTPAPPPPPPPPPDTTSPAATISSPTTNPTYSMGTTPLSIGGSASDNVAVTQVSWSNNRGGSGTCTGTSSWTAGSITLLSGQNVVTVTARDAAGNTGTDTITVTYTPPPPPPDTTSPAATISSPTANPTYSMGTTPLSIGGSASDNVAVTQVSWSNDRGGSGTCTGTSSWNASGVTLLSGLNVITVTARDAAGNTATDTLTVTYTPPPPPPVPDTTPPTATISNPSTSPTYSTGASPFSIGGSASDNLAVTQVSWSNDRGGSGACTGTSSWTAGGITLLSGQNVVTVTARDAAGNTGTDTITVTYTPPPPPPTADTTPPTVTAFTIPSTSNSLDVSISALEATDDVGVTGFLVTTSATPPSASAAGWTPSPPASLSFSAPGAYTLYGWAKDAANNVSNHISRTVTITPPDSTASPDMTIWVGKWFKITEKITGFSVGASGIVKDSGSYVGYLKFQNWDPNNKTFQADRYEQDANGQWFIEPGTLLYIAGNDLDFLCSFQVTDSATNTMEGFTARIQGRETGGVLNSATFKTLGGYYVEKSNGSGPTEHYAGGLKITGKLVDSGPN